MSTLFISHSSRDNAAAAEMRERLAKIGHKSVFLDLDPEAGLKAGVSWERTLYAKLRACRAVIALCSDSYLSSHWCFAEVALARMEGKDIFTLKIDPFGEKTQLPSILREGQYIDLRKDKDVAYEALWSGFKVKGIVPEEDRTWSPGEPPYPGLRAFDERDAPIFFGRDNEAREGVELLNRIRRQGHPRMAMVLGASGSGKSSLTRAAIVPQLRRNKSDWIVVGPFRPGQNPAREAAAAIANTFEQTGQPRSVDEIYSLLAGSDNTSPVTPTQHAPLRARDRLLEALDAAEEQLTGADAKVLKSAKRLREFLTAAEKSTQAEQISIDAGQTPLANIATRLRLQSGQLEASVLLIIDQFEELLGHDDKSPDHPANAFLRLLYQGTETDDHPPLILGTMRSDYLEALQKSESLQGIGFKSLSVGPMSHEGMGQVIVQPARLGQIILEDGLADLLLHDTSSADALPLLAFTLRAMWERFSDDRLLEISEYHELGGLKGAVAQVADETLDAALELGRKKDLRKAFLRLARPTEGGAGWARQPLDWNDVADDVRPMLQKFVDSRLLVIREDDTVEVSHESLFRSWGTLVKWLAANSEALHLLHEIQLDAAKWSDAATDEDKEPYLWRGGRLARALELAQGGVLSLKDLDEGFIDASHRAEQAILDAEAARQRRELKRARRMAAGSAIVGLVMAVLFGYALYLKHHAETLQESQINAIARVAGSITESQPLNALVEGIRAAELSGNSPVSDATKLNIRNVLESSLRSKSEKNRFVGHTDQLSRVVHSPDGSIIATTSADTTTRLWSSEGKELEVLKGHEKEVMDVAFHPDGNFIATGGADNKAIVWKLTTASDGNVTGEIVKPLLHEAGVWGVAFSPDKKLLATASLDGKVKVWRVADSFVEREFATAINHGGSVYDVAFSHDNSALATAGAGAEEKLKFWNPADGSLTKAIPLKTDVNSISFSPDNETVATASDDNLGRLWRWQDETPTAVILEGHTDKVLGITFSDDGKFLATASGDRSARLWTSAGQAFMTLRGHTDAVWGVSFEPASRAGNSRNSDRVILATASHDETARIWSFHPPRFEEFSDHDPESVVAVRTNGVGDVLTASMSKALLRNAAGEELILSIDDVLARLPPIRNDEQLKIIDADLSQTSIALLTESTDSNGGPLFTHLSLWSVGGSWLQTTGAACVDGRQDCSAAERPLFIDVRFDTSGDSIAIIGQHANGKGQITIQAVPTDVSNTADSHVPVDQHDVTVLTVAFSPDDRHFAMAGWDETVTIHKMHDTLVRHFTGHSNFIYDLEFSADGTTLGSASDDNTVRLWMLAGDQGLAGQAPTVLRHQYSVNDLSFSPDGKILATGGDASVVAIWSRGGTLLRTLDGHQHNIHAVAFMDERTLLSSDGDSVRIWTLDPTEFQTSRSLQELLKEACAWSIDYLNNNREQKSDSYLCANARVN